jgi:2,5-diamino-6-(ribosylamino)-4(3H)-pyrimidinone 5'-phosphate reductase
MALERLLDLTTNPPTPDALYLSLAFPEPPAERPYLYINMVATVDGKIILGAPGSSAVGVGGPTDQVLFRRLQRVCDAALLGSSTLRASQVLYPPEKPRFVITATGKVPLNNRFFTDAPDRAYVLIPTDLPTPQKAILTAATHVIEVGTGRVDLPAAMRLLRQEHGIRHLLCEGGATLNGDLIQSGLADELFLSITPKIKGGSHLPTIVDGAGFPPDQYLPTTLISLYRDGDELYLRYHLAPVSAHTRP